MGSVGVVFARRRRQRSHLDQIAIRHQEDEAVAQQTTPVQWLKLGGMLINSATIAWAQPLKAPATGQLTGIYIQFVGDQKCILQILDPADRARFEEYAGGHHAACVNLDPPS